MITPRPCPFCEGTKTEFHLEIIPDSSLRSRIGYVGAEGSYDGMPCYVYLECQASLCRARGPKRLTLVGEQDLYEQAVQAWNKTL